MPFGSFAERVECDACADGRDAAKIVPDTPRKGLEAMEDSIEELDQYEADRRLELYSEYRDVARIFKFYVETELRAYLANQVEVEPLGGPNGTYFKVTMRDVWIYEAERLNRQIPEAIIWSVTDVHVQRLREED